MTISSLTPQQQADVLLEAWQQLRAMSPAEREAALSHAFNNPFYNLKVSNDSPGVSIIPRR